jgi:peptidoglycan/LPS O-acetylase OafA/YrhL
MAACMVCYTHSFDLLGLNNQEWLVAHTKQEVHVSFLGLCIFFTISGYLIAKSLYTSSSIPSYIWKRFLRIQPLLIVVSLISMFVIGPIFTNLPLHQYFTNSATYTFCRNILPMFNIQVNLPGVFENNIVGSGVNGSLWTLTVEERLYFLIIPIFFVRKYTKIIFTIIVIACNILNIYLSNHPVPFITTYFSFIIHMYPLMFLNASLMYIYSIDFKKYNKYILPTSLILTLISLQFSELFFIQIIVIPVFILSICLTKSPLNNIGKYGDFTYCIYVFSFIVQQSLIAKKIFLQSPNQLFFATIGITFLMAIPSWHLFEKKMLSYKGLVP